MEPDTAHGAQFDRLGFFFLRWTGVWAYGYSFILSASVCKFN